MKLLKFENYNQDHWPELVDLMSRFQRDLMAKDPYGRLICQPEYGEIYTRELLKKIEALDGILLWAVLDGARAGMIAALTEEPSPMDEVSASLGKIGRVQELYVEPEFRNRGIGEALMLEVEKRFRQRGYNTLKVEVFAPNSDAHRFYRRAGYSDWVVDLFKRID